jgi:hypothetical protein
METVNIATQVISTVGFPIAVACAMVYMLWYQSKQHKEESEKWASILQANTDALQNLKETIERSVNR